MRSDELRPGDLVAGKYRVRAILARQPSLLVEAFHTEFDQRVVVKVLPAWAADAKEVERFRREARVLAKLESEHVARILDVGSEKDGAFYLVRQHLDGEDLAAHVTKVGALPVEEAVTIVMQLAEAVAETHAHGIIIRELSPPNVLLARRVGGAPIAKITDFGTAKLLRDASAPAGHSSLTATAMFGLSPYSSPEMVRKAKTADGRTDVWSLGAILYYLLTGQAPFSGDIATLMLAITKDEPTPPSTLRRGLPQELDQVVAWALAKDVDRRFRDVNAFAHALAPYGGAEAAVLADRIAALHQASKAHKDGPGSRPAPRSVPPPRPGPASRPPPAAGAPASRPPPAGRGGVVAAMRSLSSEFGDLGGGDDDATYVLGADGRPGSAPSIPPPPPSLPPSPWQPGAERPRSPRLVPPAAAAGRGGGLPAPPLVPALGASSLGSGSAPSSGHVALARDASSVSPGSSAALQKASKTAGGQDRRVLVGALAAMAVLLPVILVLLLRPGEPRGVPAQGAAIAVPTPPQAAPSPDPTAKAAPPPEITAVPSAPPPPPASAAPSASAPAPVAQLDPPAGRPGSPPAGGPGATTRPPPTGGRPPREPPPREPPPRDPGPKDVPKPPAGGGGGNGNLLAIASGGSCTFLVNGSAKGSGSSVKVSLSPGNYTVTCKPSSGATKSRGVSIKAGETSMLTFKL